MEVSMKNNILTALCVLAMTASASLPLRAGDQDFTLVNKTGVAISELYVSPTSAEEWQEDVLGVDVLEDGEEVEITFSREEEECAWDIMVKDEDGNEISWDDIDLCKYSRVTLHYKKGKAWATFE
jgi:hypothetical protein